ncbi:MAG: MBL fold metallo-hydrolase [Deltaproteobacteria bacterium]|nr:MBL fold metallo-hydrolase [Deltaproteobacteria bacterium]
MKIKFWGTRGSIAVPGKDTTRYGGNTTCIELALESGKTVIIDAGTGIRPLGVKLAAEENPIDIYLLMTHIHWDHIFGFPFFRPIYNDSTRIRIDGHRNCMKGLKYTFDNKMGDGFFPIKFDDLRSKITYIDKLNDGPLDIDGVIIDSIQLQHPQGGLGFRFKEGNKRMVFLTDNELRSDAWAGRSFEDYVAFCRDADMLIHDAQYTPEEMDHRKGWGHSDYMAALDLACKAGVKKFILFHHDPSRTDAEIVKIEEKCRSCARDCKAEVVVEAAMEDSELEI